MAFYSRDACLSRQRLATRLHAQCMPPPQSTSLPAFSITADRRRARRRRYLCDAISGEASYISAAASSRHEDRGCDEFEDVTQ